jgi:hypothetical protein
MKALLFSLLVLAACASAVRAPASPGGADYRFETGVFAKENFYAHPESLSPDADPSGAYGPYNRDFDSGRGTQWYIESQRFGIDVFAAGLAWNRRDLVDRGLKIFDWGFAHQSADGSFACSDRFHSTAFFVEAAARAALLLKESAFAKDYEPWITKATPRLLAAARWLAKNVDGGMKSDSLYTHRYYLNADAFAFAGLLGGDDSLVALSRRLVKEGAAAQAPEGFNPEKHGFDTSYHAVGLVFALRYRAIAGSANVLDPMITKGLAWLKSRERADGSFDQTGNTRTGNGQEVGRDKKPKTMSWGSAARAFAEAQELGIPGGDEALARAIVAYGRAHAH